LIASNSRGTFCLIGLALINSSTRAAFLFLLASTVASTDIILYHRINKKTHTHFDSHYFLTSDEQKEILSRGKEGFEITLYRRGGGGGGGGRLLRNICSKGSGQKAVEQKRQIRAEHNEYTIV